MKSSLKLVRSFGKHLAKGAISTYRYAVSPFLAPSCRYLPTCSEYTREAIDRHGLGRGITLGLWRILRCHPFGGCGYDPVPQGKRPTGRYLSERKGT